MSDKLFGKIASALQMDAAEFIATLKDGENMLPDEQLSEKIAHTISSRLKEKGEAQLSRGVRETHEKLRKSLKVVGFEDDSKGDDFFENLKTFVSEKTQAGDPTNFEPEKLAKLTAVKKLVQDAKIEAGKEVERQTAELKQKLQLFESQISEKVVFDGLEKAFAKANVNLSDDADTRRLQLKVAKGALQYDVEVMGEKIVLKANGEDATDTFGKPIDFEKYSTEIGVKLYGAKAGDPKRNGAPPPNGGGSSNPKHTFVDAKDFNQRFNAEASADKRLEMAEAWEAQNTK